MSESILNTTKKILGLEPEYDAFDTDIIVHINTALAVLAQIGVGPPGGLFITGSETTWDELGVPEIQMNMAKTYIFLKVRALFDPPPTSFGIEALERQIQQFEWRLTILREGVPSP